MVYKMEYLSTQLNANGLYRKKHKNMDIFFAYK